MLLPSFLQDRNFLLKRVEEVDEKDEDEVMMVPEHVEEVVHIDLDDGCTLVEGEEQGVKEVDIEVDDDHDGEEERAETTVDGVDSGIDCGVRRKRTVRVVIRSRAFL